MRVQKNHNYVVLKMNKNKTKNLIPFGSKYSEPISTSTLEICLETTKQTKKKKGFLNYSPDSDDLMLPGLAVSSGSLFIGPV